MNSHNTKPTFAFHKTPVATEDDRQATEVVRNKLAKNARLAIADDADICCDPYNSTGKHVILKARLLRKDDD